MGKKPVLGLVGLCLGMALTGCKDCNCGFGHASRKDENVPVARRGKTGGTKKIETVEVLDTADTTERQRSVPNTAPITTGERKSMPAAHNYSLDSYDAPSSKPAGLGGKTIAQTPKPLQDPVLPSDGLAPRQPMPREILPTSKLDQVPEIKQPIHHEITGHKPISKADAAAAGVTPEETIEVPGETAKQPATFPKETSAVATPVVMPKAPGDLPLPLELPVVPKKVAPMSVAPSSGPMPPAPPTAVPPARTVKEARNGWESVGPPTMPQLDLPPPPPLPSTDMKPVTPAAPVGKPEVIRETRTIPSPVVSEPVPPALPPTEVKDGPEVELPVQPPVAPPAIPSPGTP